MALPGAEPTEGSDDQGSSTGVERTYTITWQEVREMLGWSSDLIAHPLDDLDKLLQVTWMLDVDILRFVC